MKKAGPRWSAEHSRLYAEQAETMRDYLRHEVTRANLNRTLSEFLSRPRRIVDIGGARGTDALWLARQGHDVVLADLDEDSLAQVPEKSLLSGTLLGTSESVLSEYGPETFDLVISHGVLMYLDWPSEELERLNKLLVPGGYLSLLNAGKIGKINRMKALGKQAELDKLRQTNKYVNEIGAVATPYLPQEIEAMLGRAGFEPVDWSGVNIRHDIDRRPLDEVPVFHRNRIINAELEDSRDPTLRPSGQMLHYIARKNT